MSRKIKIVLFFILLVVPFPGMTQGLYKSTGAEIEFLSSAPIEDIHAVSRKGISVLSAVTNEISFRVSIRSFQFRKAKMQEHFNENFMESHKYPFASFKGNIEEDIDFSKNGEFPVTLTGIMEIHGIEKNREIPATVNIQNKQINLTSIFDVACEDHDIEIPKILWRNIAEVVRVEINANYTKM